MENKLANMLLDYSLGILSKDTLVLDYQSHATDLARLVREESKKRGARVLDFARPETISLRDLRFLDKLVNQATSYLKIGGGEYRVDTKSCRKRVEQIEGDIMNKRCALKWAITQYPSEYLANKLGVSKEELYNLYFSCCFIDLNEQRKLQMETASKFAPGNVRITSQDTDINFSIIGKPHFCDGKINIPDGEIFYAVDPHSTNGQIVFDIPTLFMGGRFDYVSLRFLNGQVVEYHSNQKGRLKRLLALDDFAPFIGEFGIGTNPNAKIIGHSFFDEKVLGTFHLALGAMYKGFESRLHFDLVKKLEKCRIKNNNEDIELSF